MGDPIDELFQNGEVVSARDFAKYCGLTYPTALQLCADFHVPKIGTVYVIGRDEAEEILEAIDQAMAAAEGDPDEDEADEEDDDDAEEDDDDEDD